MPPRSQHDKDIGELKGKVESIESKINDIYRFLLGNGNAGIIERTAKLEENCQDLENIVEHQSKQIGDLKDSIIHIKEIISLHVNNNSHSFWGLVLRRDVLSVIIIFFLILNSLIPNDLNIWELIQKLF